METLPSISVDRKIERRRLSTGNKIWKASLKACLSKSVEDQSTKNVEIIWSSPNRQTPKLAQQLYVIHFNDGVKDQELQQALRLSKLNETIVYFLEVDAARNVDQQQYNVHHVREVRIC